jgi:hypothetical protein
MVLSSGASSSLAAALSDTKLFPVIETGWSDAADAVREIQPAAMVISGEVGPEFKVLAAQVAELSPYVPLIVVNPAFGLPANALPLTLTDGSVGRLGARLRAALRVRSLHGTVLRRLSGERVAQDRLRETDPLAEATALLIGRGRAYAALSVALGERTGVVGALSIEAAARHLNTRDIDGIVLAEGFSPRVVEAFLTVLAEDSRFRNLPVALTVDGDITGCDLPNLEVIIGEPSRVASNALPMISQHALEARLCRTLKSIDAGGLLDPRTGLLTCDAFNRELETAVGQSQSNGGGFSVARFHLGAGHNRAQRDAARIISRLMRRMDFGAVQDDGSILIALPETDLRNAHMVARRLRSVMKHTIYAQGDARVEPVLAVATLLGSDSAQSMLARLNEPCRIAS